MYYVLKKYANLKKKEEEEGKESSWSVCGVGKKCRPSVFLAMMPTEF